MTSEPDPGSAQGHLLHVLDERLPGDAGAALGRAGDHLGHARERAGRPGHAQRLTPGRPVPVDASRAAVPPGRRRPLPCRGRPGRSAGPGGGRTGSPWTGGRRTRPRRRRPPAAPRSRCPAPRVGGGSPIPSADMTTSRAAADGEGPTAGATAGPDRTRPPGAEPFRGGHAVPPLGRAGRRVRPRGRRTGAAASRGGRPPPPGSRDRPSSGRAGPRPPGPIPPPRRGTPRRPGASRRPGMPGDTSVARRWAYSVTRSSQPVGRHHLGGQAHGPGLLGGEGPARQDQVHRPRQPHQLGEEPGQSEGAGQAEAPVGRGQLGARRHEPEVAVAGQGEADPRGRPVDGGDDRLGDAEVVGQLGVELRAHAEAGGGHRGGRPTTRSHPVRRGRPRSSDSAPAQNPRPAPVTTMTRTDGSSLAAWRWARYSAFMAAVQAFSRSGRCEGDGGHPVPHLVARRPPDRLRGRLAARPASAADRLSTGRCRACRARRRARRCSAACSSVRVVSLTPRASRCSRATFSSRCLGST